MGFDPISLAVAAISATFQVFSARKQKKKQDRARRKAEAEADKRRGFFIPVRGKVAPLPIIYGKQIIGGTELNHNVLSSITPAVTAASNAFRQPEDFSFEGGTHNAGKNSYLMFNTALCNTQGTRIESVEDILVDSTTYKYQKKKFAHNFYVHYSGGTAEPLDTANGQPATNRFTNCAYSTNIFKLNRKEPQYNGIPRLQFLVKGNHIRTFDDLGGGSYGISGYKYSNNRVEVLFDYLTAPYGAGLLDSQIEIDSFGRAAGIAGVVAMSDQQFGGGVNGLGPLREYGTLSSFPTAQSLDDQDYFGHPSWSTIYKAVDTGKFYQFVLETNQYVEISAPRKDVYRFEGNLTIDPSQSVRDNIESILSGIPFADLVWTNDGKYRLVMNYPDTDAELEALINADNTFGDDDILRVGSIQEEFGQAAQRFNRVTVDFNNEFENFASDSISWPERGSAVHNTYLAEDNNKIYESTITSDATTPYHAMAEAEQTVRISRDSNNLEITLSRKGLRIEPGDFFKIDSELTNAPNGIWKAEEVEIRVDFSVKVRATLVTANMFAWNVPDDIPYISQPVFDFTISKPTNLQASTGAEFFKGAVSNSYVDLTWDTVYSDASYLIEYKKLADVVWQTATSVSTSVRIPSLDGGKDYHAIVRTILTSGIESEPTHIAFTSGADDTVPKPPQNLVATAEGTVIDLTWDGVTQNVDNSPLLDFKEYQIYRSSSANLTTLVGTEVGSKFTDSNRLPNTLYNYRVRAVDTQGNFSAYSDNIQVTSQAPVTSGITSNAVYVTQGQIIYDPNAGTYSDTFLDIDVTFIKAGLTVARNRYRLSRSGNTWSAPVTDRSADIPDEVNVGFITPSVNVSGELATVTFQFNDGTSIALTSLPFVIVSSSTGGVIGSDGPVGARGPGRWNIPVTSLPTSASTAQTRWNSDLNTPTPPISSDQAWFYTGAQASPTSQSVWIYTGSTWVKQDEVIDGNLLVRDTLTADKISIGDGSLSSDGSGKLIVKGGNITQLEDNFYTANLPLSGVNALLLAGGASLDIPPSYTADVQIAVSFEHTYSNLVADNDDWGYKIEAGSPYVLMDVSCGFMNSLSSYTILDLGNAGQANWNALDGTTGQTKSVGSTISTTNIIDRPVTSVISGVTYVIKSLGSTSQNTWNNMAGTTGVLYNPGDLFSATTTGTGTGTVDIYQGDGKVRGTGSHVIKQRFLSPMVQETDYATVVSVVKDLENIRVLDGNPAESNFNVFVYWIGESGDIGLLDCISSIFVRFK